MSISADLLSILACPSADHAPLRLETTGSGREQLVCTSCLSRFPVSDGIAVLLADEAVPGPRGLGVPAADATSAAATSAAATSADATSAGPTSADSAAAADQPAGSSTPPADRPGTTG